LSQVAVMRPSAGQWATLTKDRTRGGVVELAWAPDGSSIYFDRLRDVPRGIFRVSVLGGEPRLVLENASTPAPLPDGSLLAVRIDEQGRSRIYRFWPETGRL